MKASLHPIAAIAAALCLTLPPGAPAAAQTVSLSCAFGQPQAHLLDASGVSGSPTGDGETSTLTLDFDALTFALGSTSGRILVEPTRVIAMARVDNMTGLWEIDRRTGALSAIGFLGDDAMALFYRANAQCARGDGGVSF
jgi:hypothetical protein